MRCLLTKRILTCIALFGAAQVIGASSRADWFDAYQADSVTESLSTAAPESLDPSIAAALDENLHQLGPKEPSELLSEAEAKSTSPVALTSFLDSVSSRMSDASCDTVNCASGGRRGGLLPPWQPYISGITGVTFATLNDDNPGSPAIRNESVFTIGGALGMSFDRSNGAVRLEIEGRGRDQMTATDSDPQLGSLTLRATDVWSATVNLWRDYDVTKSVGIYVGGGLGTGGYRSTISGTGLADLYTGNDPVANFAWQAGGGVTYEYNPRIIFDVGYRFFAIDETPAVGYFAGNPFTYNERYSASELLLTVRVYEPFRRWR
jgi:opacity protein-like surface antigen